MLLHTGNSSREQTQIVPQSKKLEINFQENGPKKQSGVAIILSNETDFQPKVTKDDKEGKF